MHKNQLEMKNAISKIKTILEGIKNSLDEVEDWISDLEDKVEKKYLFRATKWKKKASKE